MNRKDIPNLIGRTVQLTNLKKTSYNGQFGFVLDWNEEKERFVVELLHDDLSGIKLFKPINLIPCLGQTENEKVIHLYTLIQNGKLVDLEQGVLLFQEIEYEKNFDYMFQKIHWLNSMLTYYTTRDQTYLPKIKQILENLIEICPFEDLLVEANFFLVNCMMTMGVKENEKIKSYCFELSLSCVENHYGHLPSIFANIVMLNGSAQLSCGDEELFQPLKTMYEECKIMILHKTCAHSTTKLFFHCIFFFLEICKKYNYLENLFEEISLIRNKMLPQNISGEEHFCLGQLFYLEENYESALYHLDQYQEFISTTFGNDIHLMMSECYNFKLNCYIQLGNQKLISKTMKQIKKFNLSSDLKEKLENAVEKITNYHKKKCSSKFCKKLEPHEGAFQNCGKCGEVHYCSRKCQKDHWKNGHKEECCKNIDKTVKTKLKCSSYNCDNIEPEVGTFKSCAKCRLAYYCSRECQKQHWSDGHKKNCCKKF